MATNISQQQVEDVTLHVTTDLGGGTRYGVAYGTYEALDAARIALQREGWGRCAITPDESRYKLEIAHTVGQQAAV